jgi:hypothetical protein
MVARLSTRLRTAIVLILGEANSVFRVAFPVLRALSRIAYPTTRPHRGIQSTITALQLHYPRGNLCTFSMLSGKTDHRTQMVDQALPIDPIGGCRRMRVMHRPILPSKKGRCDRRSVPARDPFDLSLLDLVFKASSWNATFEAALLKRRLGRAGDHSLTHRLASRIGGRGIRNACPRTAPHRPPATQGAQEGLACIPIAQESRE